MAAKRKAAAKVAKAPAASPAKTPVDVTVKGVIADPVPVPAKDSDYETVEFKATAIGFDGAILRNPELKPDERFMMKVKKGAPEPSWAVRTGAKAAKPAKPAPVARAAKAKADVAEDADADVDASVPNDEPATSRSVL